MKTHRKHTRPLPLLSHFHFHPAFPLCTEMGYKMLPRLHESCLLAPSGCRERVRATLGLSYSPALYARNSKLYFSGASHRLINFCLFVNKELPAYIDTLGNKTATTVTVSRCHSVQRFLVQDDSFSGQTTVTVAIVCHCNRCHCKR